MWLLTIVTDMFNRRPAAENPPLSTTCPNTVRLVSRSMVCRANPLLVDDLQNIRELSIQSGHSIVGHPISAVLTSHH
jgi:hypothetical protein